LHDQARYQAQLVAGQLEAIIEGAARLSWALSHQTRIMRSDLERCRDLMRSIVTDLPLYRAGIVTNRAGQVICSWPKAEGVDLGDRDYVIRPLTQTDFVVGTMIARGRITGAPALPLARRYLSGDAPYEVGGVIVLGLDLDLLGRRFQEQYSWNNRYLSVLDREGTIIIRVPGQEAVGRKVPAEAVARAGAASGTFEANDAFGRPSIIGYARTEDLLISVGYDSEAVLAQINQATWRNMGLLILVMLLAIIAAWIAGERLVRWPVTRMVDA